MYSAHVQWSDLDNEFVATSPEFPGLSALGASADEAVSALTEAIEVAVDALRADGEPIPEPRLLAPYSGQFRVRVPRSLHQALASAAEREGVSLNSFVMATLAREVAKLESPNRLRRVR